MHLSKNNITNCIFVALDTIDIDDAVNLAASLKGLVGGIKIGKEFFTAQGPHGVRQIAKLGMPLFIDLKFHDIPNTVASAVRALLPLNPFLINVHASGGADMMRAAVNAAKESNSPPYIVAVTILTSLNQLDIETIGLRGTIEERTIALAELAQNSGLDGVVCSAKEITALRKACGPDFKLVVPGIRPSWTPITTTNDQKRTTIPAHAVRMGADILVIGRPITNAKDPAEAASKIMHELV